MVWHAASSTADRVCHRALALPAAGVHAAPEDCPHLVLRSLHSSKGNRMGMHVPLYPVRHRH